MNSDKERHMKAEMVPALLHWYDHNARILPWRSEPTPYRVWISEIMLQQTRVEAVKPYYDRFMEELPDVKSLAEVEEDKLMKLWEGLGYYNRARNLKVAAQTIMEEYGGVMPDSYEEIIKLKGIGEYTAGAIGSIAYGLNVPAVDGNVLRVVARILANGEDVLKASTKKWMTKEIADIIPHDRPGDFNQALMELGATICLPNGAPKCDQCPWDTVCQAHKEEKELQFPYKAPKKSRKIEKRNVYLLEYEGRFAVRKRLGKGVLYGLWEFPNEICGQNGDSVDKIPIQKKKIIKSVDEFGKGKHIFSHIEWHMTGYHVILEKQTASEEFTWISKEEMESEYAIPAAFDFVKKYLHEEGK